MEKKIKDIAEHNLIVYNTNNKSELKAQMWLVQVAQKDVRKEVEKWVEFP